METQYRRHLTGRRLVIPTHLVAEARYGALRAGWGSRRIVDSGNRRAAGPDAGQR